MAAAERGREEGGRGSGEEVERRRGNGEERGKQGGRHGGRQEAGGSFSHAEEEKLENWLRLLKGQTWKCCQREGILVGHSISVAGGGKPVCYLLGRTHSRLPA